MTGYGAADSIDGYSESAHREAAETLVRFAKSDQVLPVLQKLNPWLKTVEGRRVWFQLLMLADYLFFGDISQKQYERDLIRLSGALAMPLAEMQIIARYALEFCRCIIFGHGHIPTVDIRFEEEGGGD